MNYKNIIKEIEKVGEEGTHGLYEWRRYISAKASTTTWFGVWDVNSHNLKNNYFIEHYDRLQLHDHQNHFDLFWNQPLLLPIFLMIY